MKSPAIIFCILSAAITTCAQDLDPRAYIKAPVKATLLIVIAAPLCGYAMKQWLSTFKFHIALHWKLFVVSMIAGSFVTLVAVSYHTIKIALMDPSTNLRHE